MRLQIALKGQSESQIRLPLQYNHLLQAMIYHSLPPEFAQFLHEKGYRGGGRIFKLFTFSRLSGLYRIGNGVISFPDQLNLVVSSPVDEFCQYLLNGLLAKNVLQLGQARLEITHLKVEKTEVPAAMIKFRTLSPIVAYSTLLKPGGGKYTCFFQPGEGEFNRVVNENLRKKHLALTGQSCGGAIGIRNLKPTRMHVLDYKGLTVKAYSGFLELQGPREMLQIALDAGLGSKNSMGFGCGEMIP